MKTFNLLVGALLFLLAEALFSTHMILNYILISKYN